MHSEPVAMAKDGSGLTARYNLPKEVRVRAILVNPKNREQFVVQVRKPNAFSGERPILLFPGGRVEGGETHMQALRREIMEEIGVDVECNTPSTLHLSSIYPPLTSTAFNNTCLEFYRVFFDGVPKNMEKGRTLAVGWMTARECARLVGMDVEIPNRERPEYHRFKKNAGYNENYKAQVGFFTALEYAGLLDFSPSP